MYIETSRLILRDWKDEDKASFARMNGDPMVMEHFPRVLDEAATGRLVDRFRDHFKKHGYGPYALELKKTGQFMGFCGLHDVEFKSHFTPATEIAWRLDYEFWGQGYATEAAEAVTKHAFDTLKLKEIVAFAVYDNTRAIHIMEKIGMKRDPKGDFEYPALRKDHPLGHFVLYRMNKKNHKQHTGDI
ncbi:MAG: GNAT family N-acetyltransferase [Alphaproteobacteria bacterium]|nr:GNAT family N-acetyltransferase [Alphaproteobacteria bacterium]